MAGEIDELAQKRAERANEVSKKLDELGVFVNLEDRILDELEIIDPTDELAQLVAYQVALKLQAVRELKKAIASEIAKGQPKPPRVRTMP